MLIKQEPLTHWINNFYGYGSWSARFWFIAHEEGGGDQPEEVAERINYFHNAFPEDNKTILCDIRSMYRHLSFPFEGPKAHLFSNLHEYRFDTNAVLHGVWKNLIAFVHGYDNEQVSDQLSYQKSDFASQSKNREALIRLYPLPAPHNHGWYYSWLDLPELPFLKSRVLYQEYVYEQRIRAILSNITEFRPEVVLMYGMNNINALKQSIQDFFPDAKFKMVKAIKRQTPQHHRTDFNGTTLLVTTQIPALRHGRIETGFDWEQFGNNIKNLSPT